MAAKIKVVVEVVCHEYGYFPYCRLFRGYDKYMEDLRRDIHRELDPLVAKEKAELKARERSKDVNASKVYEGEP